MLSKHEKNFLNTLKKQGVIQKYELTKFWGSYKYAKVKLERLHRLGLLIIMDDKILPHITRIKEILK